MTIITGRRAALQSFGLGLVAGAVGLATAGFGVAQAAVPPALTPTGAGQLNALMERLAKAPRRRDFKTVPMILTDPKRARVCRGLLQSQRPVTDRRSSHWLTSPRRASDRRAASRRSTASSQGG
jgi:hypothetical protein